MEVDRRPHPLHGTQRNVARTRDVDRDEALLQCVRCCVDTTLDEPIVGAAFAKAAAGHTLKRGYLNRDLQSACLRVCASPIPANVCGSTCRHECWSVEDDTSFCGGLGLGEADDERRKEGEENDAHGEHGRICCGDRDVCSSAIVRPQAKGRGGCEAIVEMSIVDACHQMDKGCAMPEALVIRREA